MRKQTAIQLAASAALLVTLGACETISEETTEALGSEYQAIVSPAAGGTGSGKVEVSLNNTTNSLCTDLELSPTVNMTSGGIYGPGNTLISSLDRPDGDEGGQDSKDCDTVTEAQIDAIQANPGAFWVRIDATTGNLSGPLRKE